MPALRLLATPTLAALALLAGCASNPAKRGGAIAGHDAPPEDAFEKTADPTITPQTRYAAGQLAESRSDWAGALAQYRSAVKADPNYLPPLYNMAVLQTRLAQFADAERSWRQYIAKTDNPATGYADLGYCQEKETHFAAAADSYRKGIAIDSHNEPCRMNFGLMLAKQGDEAAAREQLSVVRAPAEVCYDLGSVAEQHGNLSHAADEYAQALAIDPDMTDARQRLTVLKLSMTTQPTAAQP